MLRRLLLVAVTCLAAAAFAPTALAVSPNIVVSQVYGGGGNTGATYTHDFIELFNRGTTAVDVNGWSLQYASATGTGNFGATSTQITELGSNTIPPGGYLLVQEASTAPVGDELPPPFVVDASPIAMSATAGKVALVNTTTPLGCNGGSTPCPVAALAQIVDLVGYGGANFFEGSGPTGVTSNTTAALRGGDGCTDTDNNVSDFAIATPAPRNFSTDPNPCEVENDPVVATCGTALTTPQGVAASRSVSATDADGTVTALAIDSITPTPAAGSITLDDVVPAATDGGTATGTVNVSAAVPAGTYSVTVEATNDDAAPQSGACTFTVSVLAVKTIGEVQGTTLDSENGATDRSPFAPPTGGGNGQTVLVRGVITQKTLGRLANGTPQRGFFLQSTPTFTDGNPLTSDGIFVFMAQFADLIGGYVPQVGDEVVISGVVQEDFSFTRLRSASLVTKIGAFLDLDVVTPAFDAAPPDDLADANRYWERREGMRGTVLAGAVTVDGLDVFPSTFDGEQWLIRGDHPVANRDDPFAERVFRDPHPLDNVPAPLFDDGNGYRIMLASLGIKQTLGNADALLTAARTFETLQNDLVGGVYFAFSKYSIQTAQQPQYADGVDPSTNAPPPAFDRFVAHSVADYNVENLYDYRDDPFDGCDFTGNSGCPGVVPPFDYVPASDAVYQARLGEIATQIVEDLHAPDILLVQEAEDQDICAVVGGALDCGEPGSQVDNRDGKPDTLQELALRVEADHGVAYDAAYDRDGSDDRGIVAAFLYRSDRVQLLPATADHPVLGSSPAITYPAAALPYNTQVSNPKALNADLPDGTPGPTDGNDVYTRDPQVGYFRIWRTAIGVGGWTDLYAISEHFSSTPDSRVAQRREQARYSALIVNALASAPDGTRVVVGGDFNVYPRPDDPFAPPLAPSDQLGPLYDEAGLHNLFDTLVAEAPSAAYSYVFQGQTQTLDGQFVTDQLLDDLELARAAHVNADFPADTPGDGARGLSDHDPLVARYELVATVAGLKELVAYYGGTLQITDPKLVEKLLQHLDKGQIADFIGQVRDKTPRFIDPVAAEAMIDEAELLAD
jgi:hypothetical protein